MSSVNKLYEIVADYKLRFNGGLKYYIIASSSEEAKKKFFDKISNLTIYGCKQINDKEDVAMALYNTNEFLIL